MEAPIGFTRTESVHGFNRMELENVGQQITNGTSVLR